MGHLLYATSSFVHHFKTISEFTLEFRSKNAQLRSKLAIFYPLWPSNFTDDLVKLKGPSPKPDQALCIILSPCVNSNWSDSMKTDKLDFDLCDLDLRHLILTFCMDIICFSGNYSWKLHDD